MTDNIKKLIAASQFESSIDPAYRDLSKAADAEIERLRRVAGCLRNDMRAAGKIIDEQQKRIAELEGRIIDALACLQEHEFEPGEDPRISDLAFCVDREQNDA